MTESLFKDVMVEKFTNLGRDMDIQVHEAHSFLQRYNPKRTSTETLYLKIVKSKKQTKREF